jgi:hypothetical protein
MNAHPDLAELAQCADGTLSEADAEHIRRHLAECHSCMAAYADAVRYRAALLVDADAFRLNASDRRWIGEVVREPTGAQPGRPRALRLGAALLGTAAAAVLALVVYRGMNAMPTLGFQLSPAVQEAVAASSARGLVLPGGEKHADENAPELRSGPPSISLALDREIKATVESYEKGSRGADASARVVAALLAGGEVEAARDYAREGLQRYPHSVPLLVFGADADYRANDIAGAEARLRAAARRAPRDPLVELDLGLVLGRQGHQDEARRLLSRVANSRVAPLAARAARELSPPP